MNRIAVIISRIGIIILGLCIGLMVSECTLRFFWPQATVDNLALAYDFHCFTRGTYYSMALKANSICPLKGTEGQFPDTIIKTNSLGMRNGEITIPKPKGTIRVLVIGDSFVTGWGVTEVESLPRRLESMLRIKFPDKTIEVINAGLPSSGPSYFYLFLKNQGIAMQPDIVVVGISYLNDLVTNLYYSKWDAVDADGLPTKVSNYLITPDLGGNIVPGGLPLKFRVPYVRHLQTFALIGDYIDRLTVRANAPHSTNPINIWACLYKEECHTLDQAKVRLKKLVIGMKNLTDRNSMDLLLFLNPAEFQIDPRGRTKYDIVIPLLPVDKARPYVEFQKTYETYHIHSLDLTQVFKQYSLNDLYFKTDSHWTAEGHDVAAQAISNSISPWIAARAN